MTHSPVPLILAILCLCAAIALSILTQAQRQLWKGFTVLAVAREADDNAVLAILADQHIESPLALSQCAPLPPFKLSPFRPLAQRLPDSYEKERKRLFFDETGSFRLYYVRNNESMGLKHAARRIRDELGAQTAVNAYDIRIPAIQILLSLCLIPFSSCRRLFALRCLIINAVICITPSPLLLACGAGSLYAFFICSFFPKGLSASDCSFFPFAASLLLLSIPEAFADGLTAGLSFSLITASCLLLSYSTHWHTIRTLRMQRLFIIAPMAVSLYTLAGAQEGPSPPMRLPAPIPSAARGLGFSSEAWELYLAEKTEERLIDFGDYAAWKWKGESFAYRKLTESQKNRPSAGDSLTMPTYYESDGRLVQQNTTVFRFDDEFLSDLVRDARSSFPSVEALLAYQNDFVYTGYRTQAASSGYEREALLSALVSLITMLCIFLFGKRL